MLAGECILSAADKMTIKTKWIHLPTANNDPKMVKWERALLDDGVLPEIQLQHAMNQCQTSIELL
jgi:hypothetical protein